MKRVRDILRELPADASVLELARSLEAARSFDEPAPEVAEALGAAFGVAMEQWRIRVTCADPALGTTRTLSTDDVELAAREGRGLERKLSALALDFLRAAERVADRARVSLSLDAAVPQNDRLVVEARFPEDPPVERREGAALESAWALGTAMPADAVTQMQRAAAGLRAALRAGSGPAATVTVRTLG